MSRIKLVLNDDQIQYIKEHYPNTERKVLAQNMGFSENALIILLHKYRILKEKSPQLNAGDIFGNVKVIDPSFRELDSNGKTRTSRANCECMLCGTIWVARTKSLLVGDIKSCGCDIESKITRKYSVNHQFFDTWSSDMAYILGFITADGNVYKTCLRTTIKDTDVQVLEYMKEKMEYTGPITHRKVKISSNNEEDRFTYNVNLKISSYVIVDKLMEYGVCPAKTGKEVLPDIPEEYFYDYIRGLFDGDGCVYFNKGKNHTYLRTGFYCASKKFLESIQERMGGAGRISARSHANCYVLNLAHKQSLVMASKMYANDCFSLKRKQDRFTKNGL